MSEYNLGRVTPIFCGDWGNQTAYKYLDVVLYGGASYVSKGDTPAGALPTDTNYWQLVAKGSEITPEVIEQIAELVKQRMGDDFVQDPDYVHTDNNLTDELVKKIEDGEKREVGLYTTNSSHWEYHYYTVVLQDIYDNIISGKYTVDSLFYQHPTRPVLALSYKNNEFTITTITEKAKYYKEDDRWYWMTVVENPSEVVLRVQYDDRTTLEEHLKQLDRGRYQRVYVDLRAGDRGEEVTGEALYLNSNEAYIYQTSDHSDDPDYVERYYFLMNDRTSISEDLGDYRYVYSAKYLVIKKLNGVVVEWTLTPIEEGEEVLRIIPDYQPNEHNAEVYAILKAKFDAGEPYPKIIEDVDLIVIHNQRVICRVQWQDTNHTFELLSFDYGASGIYYTEYTLHSNGRLYSYNYRYLAKRDDIKNSTITIKQGDNEQSFSLNQDSNQIIEIDEGQPHWFGTKAEFDALEEKDPNTIYHIDDGIDAHWFGSQEEFDAIDPKDPNTIYFIGD